MPRKRRRTRRSTRPPRKPIEEEPVLIVADDEDDEAAAAAEEPTPEDAGMSVVEADAEGVELEDIVEDEADEEEADDTLLKKSKKTKTMSPASSMRTSKEGRTLSGVTKCPSQSRTPIWKWGHSSAGRALEWHSRGQRFDPAWLHHPSLPRSFGWQASSLNRSEGWWSQAGSNADLLNTIQALSQLSYGHFQIGVRDWKPDSVKNFVTA